MMSMEIVGNCAFCKEVTTRMYEIGDDLICWLCYESLLDSMGEDVNQNENEG